MVYVQNSPNATYWKHSCMFFGVCHAILAILEGPYQCNIIVEAENIKVAKLFCVIFLGFSTSVLLCNIKWEIVYFMLKNIQWCITHLWLWNMLDMFGRLLLNTHKMFDKENKNGHWYLPVNSWDKCLTEAKNVWQSADSPSGILSDMPEIIFTDTLPIKLWLSTM